MQPSVAFKQHRNGNMQHELGTGLDCQTSQQQGRKQQKKVTHDSSYTWHAQMLTHTCAVHVCMSLKVLEAFRKDIRTQLKDAFSSLFQSEPLVVIGGTAWSGDKTQKRWGQHERRLMTEEGRAETKSVAEWGGQENEGWDAPCCSSRVMDPSCLFTTDEGESGTQMTSTEHPTLTSKLRALTVKGLRS